MAELGFFRYTGRSDREILSFVTNSWLYPHEIDKAREVAKTGTDEECSAYLEQLRKEANGRLEQWRWSQ